MSISVGAGMAIAGGAGLLGAGANAVATGNMNKKNRQWQEKMYARQLADERNNWQMQNAYNEEIYNKYNSPVAQARQMMQAGLNPDLQDVSAGGFSPSGEIGSASVPSVSGQNPIDFVGAFMNLAELVQGLRSNSLDNQLKQSEIDKISKSYAMDYLVKTYNPNFDKKKELVGFSDTMNDTIKASKSVGDLSTYFRAQGLSRRAANLAAHFVHTTNVEDVRSEYYSRKHSSESNRKSYLSDIADPSFAEKDNDMVKSLNNVLARKSDLDRFVDEARKAQANYQSDYYNSKDGSRVAQGEQINLDESNNTLKYSNEARKNSFEVDKRFNDWVSNIKNPFEQMLMRCLYNLLKNVPVGGLVGAGVKAML